MISFERLQQPNVKAVGIIGDTLAKAIGAPVDVYGALVFNVTTQPSGSDIFTAGTDVAYATAIAAAFTHSGRHVLTVKTGDALNLRSFEVIVWPAAALDVARIKYVSQEQVTTRSDPDRRNILRSLSNHASVAGIVAALEGGAAIAPFYGTQPSVLGAGKTDDMTVFGSW